MLWYKIIHLLVRHAQPGLRSSITQVCISAHIFTYSSSNILEGIMHPEDDNALNTEERIWDLTMQINLKGVWWGSKYAIIAMRENPTDESKGLRVGGSIINTASFVALMGAATPQLACTFLPDPLKLCGT